MNVHLRACRTRAAVQAEPHRLRFAARGNSSLFIGSILLKSRLSYCRLIPLMPQAAVTIHRGRHLRLLWRSIAERPRISHEA